MAGLLDYMRFDPSRESPETAQRYDPRYDSKESMLALTPSLGLLSAPYGYREDGTKKGRGWLGELNTKDGRVMTELSADADGMFFPLITPNQGFKDLSNVVNGGKPSDEMYRQAIIHALMQMKAGKSPFKE